MNQIVKQDSGIAVRIRDNGPYFSPLAYLEQHKDESQEAKPGLEIVSAFTETFTYRRGMNLNVVVMTVRSV